MDNSQGNYQLSACITVSVYEDGRDGDGNYKMVVKLEHKGHQSYGQRLTVTFSDSFSVVEVPGDVKAEVSGNRLTLQRDNQLNDNGLTEIWIKLAAVAQPEVVGISEVSCCRKESVEPLHSSLDSSSL